MLALLPWWGFNQQNCPQGYRQKIELTKQLTRDIETLSEGLHANSSSDKVSA